MADISSLNAGGANADRTATEHRIMEAAVEDPTRLGIQLTTPALKDLRPEGAVREARSDNEIKVGDVVKVIGSSGGVLIVSKNEPDKVEG